MVIPRDLSQQIMSKIFAYHIIIRTLQAYEIVESP